MDFQKEKEAYLGELLERDVITQDEFRDLVFKPEINAFDSNYLSSRFIDKINFGWSAWQAKAQAVPEGFVLVPKENISCYWQDNDEPENFCSNESDFDCLGDCIDLGEIMEINKFTQAHVNKEILFGTWFAEAIDPSEKANFFVGAHAECLEIVAKNKAMIEAQEQSHECQNP
jgi:hypothetical protein